MVRLERELAEADVRVRDGAESEAERRCGRIVGASEASVMVLPKVYDQVWERQTRGKTLATAVQ